MGASIETLVEMFQLSIRNLMEQGAPVFTGGLSQGNINDFENVQKQAFKIILRGNYESYPSALTTLNQDTLEERRIVISLKFAKKSIHPMKFH